MLETGSYLALDLGGTNFRVLMFTFEKGGKYQMVREKYEFSAETKVGSGEKVYIRLRNYK